ncbi:MAG: isoleucine--tRNA ligase [Eubacteriaceae bacterium]|jgi:isoleucyl-tRNA synthetase
MKIFEPLSNQSVRETEQAISKEWEDMNILEKTTKNREGNENFVFYEGPPTANGKPGIHHVLARTLKDSVNKYQVMNGKHVVRKAGWDTHGLPVEIEVEKKLGIENKPEIEAYGIGKFNEQCKESVFSYEKQWREMTKRMGYFIDLDDPYITLNNDYIESVWWALNKFFKEGYIYEGHKIMPYCPRCGTGLASHEVAQGYQEDKTNTVVCAFKRTDADEYFLVWTTTPWTLAANVALAVNPKADYIRAESRGDVYICAENLAPKLLGDDYKVIDRFKGTELEGLEYERLMDFVPVPPRKKAFYVTTADYVTTEDGTGIVHIAPAFGEDDYQVGRKYDLPVLQPVDEEGMYTATPWKGRFVLEDGLDIEIIKWLKDNGKLFKKEKVVHNYPHCWRCKTPLLYYAKPSWYIEMTKLKDKLVENNNGVNWFPDFVGEKRFGNWLENLNDWAISRSRYWGTPLNIWRCDNEECGEVTSVGSRKELAERAIEDIDENIELHRPYVDDVHLTCPKCGGRMTRVTDVIDCWFDSGSMPFAQYHYPFENQEKWESQFPADFICEGIDQTRGWFYSLLAISTFLTGKAPYKNVLVNDLVLDKNGQKMSKSKGNTVDPFRLFDDYGADALRWYLLFVSPAWTPTRFDEEGIKEVLSKFFGTFKNTYNFFSLYANTDGIDPRTFYIEPADRPVIDRWILSKYNRLVRDVRDDMEHYDLTRAVRSIQDFVNEDLSNWYIRRNRRRFWGSEMSDDKRAVYNTTYEVLEGLARLCAPFAPYISEEIYQSLTGNESVHLADYPQVDAALISDEIEEPMDLTRHLVSLGRSAREDAGIKVRQPLSEVIISGEDREKIESLVPLIKEELNVRNVVFSDDLSDFMNFTIKPDFKKAGPVLGKKVKLFAKALAQADAAALVSKLDAGETVDMDLDGETFGVTRDMADIRISAKEGFNVQTEDNDFVILETQLNDDLIAEGYAREIVSKIQQLRKSSGFDVADHIDVKLYSDDSEITEAARTYHDYISKETLADSLEFTDEKGTEADINGHKIGFTLSRV